MSIMICYWDVLFRIYHICAFRALKELREEVWERGTGSLSTRAATLLKEARILLLFYCNCCLLQYFAFQHLSLYKSSLKRLPRELDSTYI